MEYATQGAQPCFLFPLLDKTGVTAEPNMLSPCAGWYLRFPLTVHQDLVFSCCSDGGTGTMFSRKYPFVTTGNQCHLEAGARPL